MNMNWKQTGSLVYALGDDGVNQWNFSVNPGVSTKGVRTSIEECTEVAALAAKAPQLAEALQNLMGLLDTPIMRRKMRGNAIFQEAMEEARKHLGDLDMDPIEDEPSSLELTTTQRGFGTIEFEDRYGAKCSLQESSRGGEAAIWFGPDDPDPKIMDPDKGWTSIPFPEGTLFYTRMHLTQDMVIDLLPMLQRFVRTGTLSDD